MTQVDYAIENKGASAARTEINSTFQAIADKNSGATEPTTTFKNMWWYDETTSLLKQRNFANDDWINVAYLKQDTGQWCPIADSPVFTAAGAQQGKLGGHDLTVWSNGSSAVEALIDPITFKDAVEAVADFANLTDVTASRAKNTVYTNNTGRTMLIWASVTASNASLTITVSSTLAFIASRPGNNLTVRTSGFAVVPNGGTYEFTGTGALDFVLEAY